MRRAVIALAVVAHLAVPGDARPAGAGEPEDLAEVVVRLGRTRWTSHNSVELLADPRRAWEARLDLLESAESHVFISTFSWHEDDWGRRYRRALADVVRRRTEQGGDFRAYCLADAAAVGFFNRSFDELREAGADVRSYHRSTWGMAPIFDGRMHDKIVIADGRRAIVGGRNYSDIYYDPHHWWLDLDVLVEGPAVWDLQILFLKAWEVSSDLARAHHFAWTTESIERRIRSLWATGRFPGGRSPLDPYLNERFFPALDGIPGDTRVAVLYDNSIVWDRAPTAEVLVELANRAVAELDVMTPFPNFEVELADALERAAARGVKVRLIVNDGSTALRGGMILLSSYPTLIRLIGVPGIEVWAWRANAELLAEAADSGCEPQIMPPVALHGKVVRVDDELTIVHSSNFNIRSTYYNTEAGVAVLDRAFNTRVKELLDGLVTLSNFDLSCRNPSRRLVVDSLVRRLGQDDADAMRRDLGDRQHRLDGLNVLW
ncbi:MAG: phosphatidylserine/phosphatidylglycerophosphate/cardiolipin synthase family protein [Thermoanaerobaculales bacterium]|jgi:phosphatidylserine/phosphatidylglycerophosphate/cardiolipin synthase-like enzyme|nr:phosphatidylserine/phosphatidylglycerophosphate/cardiolipin synthase family protein [Thermoanaerobaculales bacterium]